MKEILQTIHTTGLFSKRMLAKQLNISEDVVADAVDRLIQMGYLDKEEQPELCPMACSGCSFAQSCNRKIVETYRVTEKGMAFI